MPKQTKSIAGFPHSVDVSESDLSLCGVKSRYASELDLEELQALVNWCGWQDSSLWEGMTLQEILNVYRVSAKWDTWQGWASESRGQAVWAWNRAVHASNFMRD